mmetsp:Transcript_17352/g.25821  ORF Transcript_17352/g.25821 Transcript_17352/m.25821 type:complete len:279 (+) Transcript_17352:889-1725(+)
MVTAYMNRVFGSSDESTLYWNNQLKSDLRRNFPKALSEDEKSHSFDFKKILEGNDICKLFSAVIQMTALRLRSKCVQEFSADPKNFQYSQPFDETDVEEIGVVVRHMNIMALAQGYVLKSKGRDKSSQENGTRLCQLAMEKFEEALFANPGDKKALRELADTAAILKQNDRANKYYQMCIEADPLDANTLFKYAVFLETEVKRPDDAEEYFLQALERDPLHDHCLQRYADFLETQGHYDDAELFFMRAAECRLVRSQASHVAAIVADNQDENTGIFGN